MGSGWSRPLCCHLELPGWVILLWYSGDGALSSSEAGQGGRVPRVPRAWGPLPASTLRERLLSRPIDSPSPSALTPCHPQSKRSRLSLLALWVLARRPAAGHRRRCHPPKPRQTHRALSLSQQPLGTSAQLLVCPHTPHCLPLCLTQPAGGPRIPADDEPTHPLPQHPPEEL